jgi:hypothetical protein
LILEQLSGNLYSDKQNRLAHLYLLRHLSDTVTDFVWDEREIHGPTKAADRRAVCPLWEQ